LSLAHDALQERLVEGGHDVKLANSQGAEGVRGRRRSWARKQRRWWS
jgi:hypothetical protein